MSKIANIICCTLFTVLVLALGSLAHAGDGGTLKGQFFYNGDAPAAKAIVVNADKAFCGKHKLVNEELVVGKNKELANVAIYLYLRGDDEVEIHPSYDAAKAEKVVMDNAACRFSPRVALLWTEQALSLGNNDGIGHNTKIEGRENKGINPLIPPGGRLDYKEHFTNPERLPVGVSCSIHPWMKGWMVVRNNPYFAVTDAEGKFEIKHIPAGDWRFQVWQEKAGYVRKVNVGGEDVEWGAGRVEVSITEGGTVDLGKVLVDPSNFEE